MEPLYLIVFLAPYLGCLFVLRRTISKVSLYVWQVLHEDLEDGMLLGALLFVYLLFPSNTLLLAVDEILGGVRAADPRKKVVL